MWWYCCCCIVAVLVMESVAVAAVVPSAQNDISKGFQTAIQNQNLHTILASIEERLRNLDSVYSMQLSPTLESKLEQNHRRLDALDAKLIRLESLMMLNLDKISENISTKNYKDDIAKTNVQKKLDAVYEGLGHRLGYIERKVDASSNRIHTKLETTLSKLEKMEEGLASRDEDIESELSDAIAAIDDLKTTYTTMEDNIINATVENFEVSLKDQHKFLTIVVEDLLANSTGNFRQTFEKLSEATNKTEKILEDSKSDVKRELNEYAVKVADMNAENWKNAHDAEQKRNEMMVMLNSTRTELQNGVRTLMVLTGKVTKKDPVNEDQMQMDRLNEKLESNFEKVFSAQSLFMDSCYRLQMDESQIETKISDILEKLMETFEKKTAVEVKDIKNLEKMLKTHDSHMTRSSYQTTSNIIAIYEELNKNGKLLDEKMARIAEDLDTLVALVQKDDENRSPSPQSQLAVSAVDEEMVLLRQDLKEISEFMAEDRNYISRNFDNISTTLSGMEARINAAYLDYYFRVNQNNMSEPANKTVVEAVIDVDTQTEGMNEYIRQVFGVPKNVVSTNASTTETPQLRCKQNYRNLIDVRSSTDDDDDCQEETTSVGDDSTDKTVTEGSSESTTENAEYVTATA